MMVKSQQNRIESVTRPDVVTDSGAGHPGDIWRQWRWRRGWRCHLQLVTLPPHVRPGHAVRDDDPDQLVLAQPLHHHRVHLCQPVSRLGQDYLLLALLRSLHVDSDSPHGPAGQRLLNLLINHHPVRQLLLLTVKPNLLLSQVSPSSVQYSHRNKVWACGLAPAPIPFISNLYNYLNVHIMCV